MPAEFQRYSCFAQALNFRVQAHSLLRDLVAVTGRRAPRKTRLASPVRASPTTSTRLPEIESTGRTATSISKSSTKTAQKPAPQSRSAQ